MRVRVHPVGQEQPYVVLRVPDTWEEFTATARQRLGTLAGIPQRFFLPDGAEVLSLDDLDAEDVRCSCIGHFTAPRY